MADGLLNKASIILTPTGYKAGTLYNVAPIDEPYEDFDFARTSTATRINSSGLVSNVATGVPRISYDSNGDNGHILLEPTSTNLIPYSEDFSEWTTSNFTANSETTTAPNGDTVNGYDFGDGFIFINTANLDGSSSYTNTIYIKANKSATIGMRKGGAGSGPDNASINLTTDWQRFEATSVATITTNGRLLLDNRAASGYGVADLEVFIWGAQQEKLSYSTSYIPTLTGSQEVRATETATGAGSADLINSTEGVLYAEIAALADDTITKVISLSDSSSNNKIELFYFNGTTIYINVFSNGISQGLLGNITDIVNFNKIAFKYKVNDFALWVNGVEVATDTSASTPIGLTELAFDNGTGGNPFYGKVKALVVFNEALSDSELTQLTT